MRSHHTDTNISSAYDSSNPSPLPAPERHRHNDRNGLFDTHLSFGHYSHLDSTMEIAGQLKHERDSIRLDSENTSIPTNIYCNEKRWKYQNSSKLPFTIAMVKMGLYCVSWFFSASSLLTEILPNDWLREVIALCIIIFSIPLIFIFILIITSSLEGRRRHHAFLIPALTAVMLSCFHQYGSLSGEHELQFIFWFSTTLYLIATFGLDLSLWLHLKRWKHDGSEFNRTDGMVRFKRRFRRLFVAPFDEFDPVLQLLPSGHGGHDYTIWLHHRYSSNKVCLAHNLHSLGLDRENALALWDTLQRYMDITQPLPELPILEQSRHRDPVTAEHDQRTGRDPRYWRKQTYRGWQRKTRPALDQQLKEYPWQQHPCIVRARIDTTLSIEDYYRRQEAKGIFASMKADDFRSYGL